MGFIFKDSKGRSQNFYIGYRLASGQWRKVSAKTADKAKARLMLAGLENAEALAGSGVATEEQIRRLMAETIERVTGKAPLDPSIAEWLDQWLCTQQGTVKEKTFARYTQVVRDLKQSLGPIVSRRLRLIPKDALLAHRDRLLKEGCSPSTVNHAFKTLITLFADAIKAGLLSSNPANIKALKAQKAARIPFTPEQIECLLTTAKGDMIGLVLLGAFTGQRLMDIAKLSWRKVDLEAGLIRFYQSKTEQDLPMPLHPQVAEFLLARAGDNPDAPLLPELFHKKGSGSSGLSVMFTQLMQEARIDAPVVRERSGARGRTTRALSFHSLRYAFNSQLANGDVSQELRRKLTGHSSDAMNDVYTKLELSVLRRAVESLPSIPSLRVP
jgi:integrase